MKLYFSLFYCSWMLDKMKLLKSYETKSKLYDLPGPPTYKL